MSDRGPFRSGDPRRAGGRGGGGGEQAHYGEFEASELFCPKCRQAQPVRQHLLLVLPTGKKYEYRCAVCATPVGDRDDDDTREFSETLKQAGRVVGDSKP